MPIEEPRSLAEMESLTIDDKILIVSQRQEVGSRAQLVEALMRMGRWNEALVIEVDPENLKFIQSLKDGEEIDDRERCDCVHMVDTTDYVQHGKAIEAGEREPDLKQHPHYQRIFRHYSSSHGGMVWANRCHLCGHVQSIEGDIDELHAAYSGVQTSTMAIEYARTAAKVNGRPMDRPKLF